MPTWSSDIFSIALGEFAKKRKRAKRWQMSCWPRCNSGNSHVFLMVRPIIETAGHLLRYAFKIRLKPHLRIRAGWLYTIVLDIRPARRFELSVCGVHHLGTGPT